MKLSFRKWLLKEVGTSTASVASFKRIAIPGPVRRRWLGPWGEEDPFFKKKKKKI